VILLALSLVVAVAGAFPLEPVGLNVQLVNSRHAQQLAGATRNKEPSWILQQVDVGDRLYAGHVDHKRVVSIVELRNLTAGSGVLC
jgi:hypothetical protein